MRYDFASDNTAGLCPEAREVLLETDVGFAAPYGDDPWTAAAADSIRELFENDCDVYFVFNGTAANSLALATLCQPYQSVISHELSHIETDECGAPEFFSNGSKVLVAGGNRAQLDPNEVRRVATRRTDIHYPQPRALTVTQPTELGTVYQPGALAELGETARQLGLRFHLDGARFANAVAALGCAPKEISWEVGIDVLCLGGVKNGIGLGEAVVFFDRELSREFDYRCKQAGQLASKMRFLAAPWARLLRDGTWLRNAQHANAMARRLKAALDGIGVGVAYPVEANAVFAQLDRHQLRAVNDDGWAVYDFIGGAVRLMCSWQTTEASIDELVGCIAAAKT